MKWPVSAGLFLLIIGLCLVTAGSSQAQPPTAVNISPSGQTVNSDQTFNAGVYVVPGEPIIGVSFSLTFNATLLQANSVTEGGLLNQGCGTIFLPGTINNTTGTITGVAGATKSSCTVSNPGTFVNISFTARNVAGMSFIDMSSVAVSDVKPSPVAVSVTNGIVTVGSGATPGATATSAPTPSPTVTPVVTATPGVTATPAPTPSITATPGATTTSAATPTPDASPAATPTTTDLPNINGTSPRTSPWVWAVLVVIAALAAIAVAAVSYRRSRHNQP